MAGAELKLPEDGVKAPEKHEWFVVLGGTGTVGQLAVQVNETVVLLNVISNHSRLPMLVDTRSWRRAPRPRTL